MYTFLVKVMKIRYSVSILGLYSYLRLEYGDFISSELLERQERAIYIQC
jgi:hypothetical protein